MNNNYGPHYKTHLGLIKEVCVVDILKLKKYGKFSTRISCL